MDSTLSVVITMSDREDEPVISKTKKTVNRALISKTMKFESPLKIIFDEIYQRK